MCMRKYSVSAIEYSNHSSWVRAAKNSHFPLAYLCYIIWTRINANNWKIKIQKLKPQIFFLCFSCSSFVHVKNQNANIICKLYMCSNASPPNTFLSCLYIRNMETFFTLMLKKKLNDFFFCPCWVTRINFFIIIIIEQECG